MIRNEIVSVIMPAYNAERWILESIASVVQQTHPHLELIIVDDGSSDGTLELARSHDDPRIKVISQANRGASAARNEGLRHSSGRWIQYLDADDLLAPNKIAVHVASARTRPNSVLFSGAWGRFRKEIDTAVFHDCALWQTLSPAHWLKHALSLNLMMHPAAWFVPRELHDAAGPWNEGITVNDDGEYFARVITSASVVDFVPEAKTYYRSGISTSLSQRTSARDWQSQFDALESVRNQISRLPDGSVEAWSIAMARLAISAYPDCPAIMNCALQATSREAMQRAISEQPRLFRRASTVVGWKLARRLQHMRKALKRT